MSICHGLARRAFKTEAPPRTHRNTHTKCKCASHKPAGPLKLDYSFEGQTHMSTFPLTPGLTPWMWSQQSWIYICHIQCDNWRNEWLFILDVLFFLFCHRCPRAAAVFSHYINTLTNFPFVSLLQLQREREREREKESWSWWHLKLLIYL